MTATTTSSTRAPGSKNALLFVVCLAQFMVILDLVIVNVALPSMRSGLHFSTTGLGRRRWPGRVIGSAPRRGPDPGLRLAGDLRGQRADRHGRGGARLALDPVDRARRRDAPL